MSNEGTQGRDWTFHPLSFRQKQSTHSHHQLDDERHTDGDGPEMSKEQLVSARTIGRMTTFQGHAHSILRDQNTLNPL